MIPFVDNPDATSLPDDVSLSPEQLSPTELYSTPYRELSKDKKFALILYLCITLLCILTVVVLFYIMVKVIQKVWDSDKIIPIMLANLQLAALCTGLFFLEQIVLIKNYDGTSENVCMTTIIPYCNTMFLAIAVILNINKWIYFTLRIMTKVRCTQKEELFNEHLREEEAFNSQI